MNITPATVATGAIAVIVFYYLLKKEAKKAVDAVGNAVNPVNPENVFYEGVNSVGEVLTGEEGFSLGGWIYDQTHANQVKD